MPDASDEKQRATHRDTLIGWGILALILTIGLVPWLYTQGWSGLGASAIPKDERAKSLWDWMELLGIPLVLASGALFFEWRTRTTDYEIAEKRKAYEEQIASDNLHEQTFQTFFDQITGLLLEKDLRNSPEGSDLRNIARVRTITAMRRLDGKRNGLVINFLLDAGLIEHTGIGVALQQGDLSRIDLSYANLSRRGLLDADLHDSDLRGAKLRWANLARVNLSGANLEGADLYGARAVSANMQGANLRRASLVGTWLHGATLKDADLEEADLSNSKIGGTDFSNANLRNAIIRTNFSDANLQNAIMPDGSVHP